MERGDEVLVEPSAGEFFEARVLALEGTGSNPALKLQRSDGELTSVSAGDVYRLRRASEGRFAADRRGQPGELRPRDLAVCEIQRRQWVGCRIKAGLSSGYRTEDYEGVERELAAGKIVLPSELTRMNLEQRFKLADRRRVFDAQARRAGDPEAPSGFSPGYKERVLAKRGERWFSAHIVRFHDDGSFRVRWMADNRENDVAKAEVIPEPPYRTPPQRGGFVLLKPNVMSLPWSPLRVVSVRPDLVLEDGSGEQKNASLREVVPLPLSASAR